MNDPRPQALATTWPRMAPAAKKHAEAALSSGCYCGSPTATFKKRQIGASVTVWLQCDGCGKGYNNSFKRADHYAWQDYPVWDDTLRDKYDAQRRVEQEERLAGFRDEHAAAQAQFAARREEYAAWCRSSPEWAEMRQRILWRSRTHCEACLANRAEFIHHLTYRFGKLPPAWCLRAVCEECHRRLHDGDDDWCESWAAR